MTAEGDEIGTLKGSETSPLAGALDQVGDRWTLLIVAALLEGPRRFGDLERELDGIAPNVLSGRLRRLADDGLLVAEPYCERPPRFVYELTERGRALGGPIAQLSAWGARRGEGTGRVHAACGSPLEQVWYCPTCRAPVEEDEAGELDYA